MQGPVRDERRQDAGVRDGNQRITVAAQDQGRLPDQRAGRTGWSTRRPRPTDRGTRDRNWSAALCRKSCRTSSMWVSGSTPYIMPAAAWIAKVLRRHHFRQHPRLSGYGQQPVLVLIRISRRQRPGTARRTAGRVRHPRRNRGRRPGRNRDHPANPRPGAANWGKSHRSNATGEPPTPGTSTLMISMSGSRASISRSKIS